MRWDVRSKVLISEMGLRLVAPMYNYCKYTSNVGYRNRVFTSEMGCRKLGPHK